MIHDMFIVGEIRKINVSTPRDPRKGPSAVILVQWGPMREQSGGPVDFINAGLVRIPNYRFPRLQDKLKVGQRVKINGHLQGVVKSITEESYISNELVADRVVIIDESGVETEAEVVSADTQTAESEQ